MANVDTNACTYAALILHDAGLPTSADNINKLTAAAGIEVRSTIPILFSRFLEKKGMGALIAASSSAAPAASSAAPAAGAAPAAPAAGKPAPKKVEEEEDDDDMGGLF
jgi:large subunit ribosomal protein LP1